MTNEQINMIRAIIDHPEMRVVQCATGDKLGMSDAIRNVIGCYGVEFLCPFKVGDRIVNRVFQTHYGVIQDIEDLRMNPCPQLRVSYDNGVIKEINLIDACKY